MESLWLIIVLFFILLLIFPQVFKLYVAYSPLENSGLVVIKLWAIKIKYFSFQFKKTGIIIRTAKERKQIEYNFNDPHIKFYEDFTRELKQKVKLKYIDINSNIGTGDACESAILSGAINIFYNVLGSYIKNSKPSGTVMINSNTEFNKKVFDFSVYSKTSIAIFDVLYSLLIAFLNKK